MGSSYLLLDELRVHYLHWNLADGGQPIVLLHGLASNARIWELTAPILASQGFTLIAPDARGHGLTDKPDGDYGFETFRHDLAAFIDALGLESPILVGHSWGAFRAVDYAAQVQIGPRAAPGVFLVDGGLTQLDDAPGATWEKVRDRLTPPRLGGTSAEAFLARLSAGALSWDTEGRAAQIILANFEIDQDEAIWPRLNFERHMKIVRAMWEFQTYERLARLRCPAWAVLAQPPEPVSAQDVSFLANKQRGAAQAGQIKPDLKVIWMADTIHDIPLQRPVELAGLIVEFASQIAKPR